MTIRVLFPIRFRVLGNRVESSLTCTFRAQQFYLFYYILFLAQTDVLNPIETLERFFPARDFLYARIPDLILGPGPVIAIERCYPFFFSRSFRVHLVVKSQTEGKDKIRDPESASINNRE